MGEERVGDKCFKYLSNQLIKALLRALPSSIL